MASTSKDSAPPEATRRPSLLSPTPSRRSTLKATTSATAGLGVKYQAFPGDVDNTIILHMRMLDKENPLQQETLGILGVNLLYAAFFLHHTPNLMLESLLDNLTTDRLEIDMIDFSGIEFRRVDNRGNGAIAGCPPTHL